MSCTSAASSAIILLCAGFLRGCHDEEQSYDRCLSAAFCPQPEAASRHDSLAAARTEEPLKKLRLREQSGGVPDGTGEYEREFLFCERAFLRSARRHLLTFAVQRRIWQPKQLMAANPAADPRPRRRDICGKRAGMPGMCHKGAKRAANSRGFRCTLRVSRPFLHSANVFEAALVLLSQALPKQRASVLNNQTVSGLAFIVPCGT